MSALPPIPMLPMLQVTVPGTLWKQVPCVAVAETKLTVAGSGSVTVTPVALDGPLFRTCDRVRERLADGRRGRASRRW